MNAPITAWSYSRYSDYERCPAFFKYKYILKLPTTAGPAMARGREIHKMAEDYLKAPKAGKVPPELKHFGTELKQLHRLSPLVECQWGFRTDWSPTGWFGTDVWARGIADVAVAYEDLTIDVVDWKTGKKYQTNEDQMELFGLLSLCKFPEYESVRTLLWYTDLADDNEVERVYARKDVEGLKKKWAKAVVPMFADKKYPPRPNDKCKWCDFSKGKGGPCAF